jgi:DNA-binding NarL/FixJ family response regulator
MESPRMIGVLLVDDQLVFRRAAHEVIDATEHFELVGEAVSGLRAVAAFDELRPDLVLVDVRMPEMDGFETAARLHARPHPSVVVLITIAEAPDVPAGLASCGAAALVRKQDFGPALLRRLWEAHAPPGGQTAD